MSGNFGLIHRIFNATPPAYSKKASFAPAPEPIPAAPPSGGNTTVQSYLERLAAEARTTTVQSYLERLAEEARTTTGVAKYLIKLEWDDFNNRNRPAPPTGVERYLSSQRQVARPVPPAGPTGVQKYLDKLIGAAA